MRIYLLGCLFVLFLSCEQKKVVVTEYNYFVADIWNKNSTKDKYVIYKVLLEGDSLSIYKRDNGIRNKFKFALDAKGIYIVENEKLKLLYSFEKNVKILRDSSLTKNFYNEVELIDKKKYIINEVEYQIYHFSEIDYDTTLDSYYLEGEGFICFYEFKGSEFLYLDSSKALEVYKIFSEDYSFNAVLQAEMMRKNVLKRREN